MTAVQHLALQTTLVGLRKLAIFEDSYKDLGVDIPNNSRLRGVIDKSLPTGSLYSMLANHFPLFNVRSPVRAGKAESLALATEGEDAEVAESVKNPLWHSIKSALIGAGIGAVPGMVVGGISGGSLGDTPGGTTVSAVGGMGLGAAAGAGLGGLAGWMTSSFDRAKQIENIKAKAMASPSLHPISRRPGLAAVFAYPSEQGKEVMIRQMLEQQHDVALAPIIASNLLGQVGMEVGKLPGYAVAQPGLNRLSQLREESIANIAGAGAPPDMSDMTLPMASLSAGSALSSAGSLAGLRAGNLAGLTAIRGRNEELAEKLRARL